MCFPRLAPSMCFPALSSFCVFPCIARPMCFPAHSTLCVFSRAQHHYIFHRSWSRLCSGLPLICFVIFVNIDEMNDFCFLLYFRRVQKHQTTRNKEMASGSHREIPLPLQQTEGPQRPVHESCSSIVHRLTRISLEAVEAILRQRRPFQEQRGTAYTCTEKEKTLSLEYLYIPYLNVSFDWLKKTTTLGSSNSDGVFVRNRIEPTGFTDDTPNAERRMFSVGLRKLFIA